MSPQLQKALKIVNLAQLRMSGNRFLWVWQLNDPGLENFDYLQDARLFFLTTDAWLLNEEALEEEDIVIMDVKDISLRILTKFNLSIARTLSKYQQDAIPIRLKQVHVVNAPSFIDKVYGLVKPFLKQGMTDMMPQDTNHDLVAIRDWLAKEPYLPQDLDDFMIKKFLHSCYGSLEKTKKCIEKFCTTRSSLTELYTNRDPTSVKMKTAFSITSVVTYKAGADEILIHQLDDPPLEKFSFYDILKAFTLQADYWLKVHDFFPEGHIIVLDIKDYSLRIIPKVNVMYFRDFLIYLLEGMPVRVKQVHAVNCPSYYEKLYALVKPALPAEICNIITFHSNVQSLQKSVDKKYLPAEYGGDAQSMKEQHQFWISKIEEERKMFLNDGMWKADLKLKPKSNAVENVMNGSFRTLSID
ncbi:alpha-tocopherol transfer protein-like isoform X2 [Ostrinia nubilalis]